MNLEDVYRAVRAEVELMHVDLALWSDAIAGTSAAPERRGEALEAYAAQLGRLADTTEMLNLAGLATWCRRLTDTLRLATTAGGPEEALPAETLIGWSEPMLAYLDAPLDFDAAAALVAHLSDPRLPQPFDEAEGMALMDALLAPPELPAEFSDAGAGTPDAPETHAPIQVTEADTSLALPEDVDRDVYNAFIDEAPSWATELGAVIAKLAGGAVVLEDVRAAKRLAHSFKGSANIVGIRAIGVLAHHMEDLLEHLERNPSALPAALAATLLDAAACLEQMVFALLGAEDAPRNAFAVLKTVVEWNALAKSGAITADSTVTVSETRTSEQPAAPSAPATAEQRPSLRVPVATIDELFRTVSQLTTQVDTLEERLRAANARSRALVEQNRAAGRRLAELENIVMLRGRALAHEPGDGGTLDPLELDRYNELHSVTRMLAEAMTDAREVGGELEFDLQELANHARHHGRINGEIRRLVVGTRMTPVEVLVPRLARNVRQTCQATGKRASLHVSGGAVLVDGEILNRLADPLLHILRNAVDHGIELPQERLAAGKPEEGRIDLEFEQQGPRVRLRVRDDGRGLNYVAIRAKALASGLITPDQQLAESELARLTLLPGFSTRDRVTEISGRGVGMDVVVSRLKELNGSLEVTSETGSGCEIGLRFQTSLVTQHALIVRVGNESFALPIHSVERAIPPGLGTFAAIGAELAYELGGEIYPAQTLAALLGGAAPEVEALAECPVVLVQGTEQTTALVVDGLVASREVIVQSIGACIAGLAGIAGATILANGSVAPLLNVAALLDSGVSGTVDAAAAQALANRVVEAMPRVLVVDDSLSVRKSLARVLGDASFEVIMAGDGLEAIKAIERSKPALVLTDLEMPNMNGLELTEHLRRDPATRALPVIMITSRSMTKHRELAEAAGVSAYLTKPVTDEDLLQQVRAMTLRAPQQANQ